MQMKELVEKGIQALAGVGQLAEWHPVYQKLAGSFLVRAHS